MSGSRLSQGALALFAAVLWSGVAAHASALTDAVKAGDAQQVKALIAGGANVKARDFFGTPLHAAVAGGFPEIATMLIDAGADVEALGISKARPLHTAAVTDHAAVAALLIARGAEVDALDAEGMTPLLVATENDNADVAEVLLKAGADPLLEGGSEHFAPIQLAAYSCRPSVMQLFLSKGLDINRRNATNGQTPLFALAMEVHALTTPDETTCRIKMTELLLASGADPNIGDNSGRTPLEQATANATIHDLLVKAGAK